MDRDFINRFVTENENGNFWDLKKKLCAILLVVFFGLIMINTTGCTQNNSGDVSPSEDISIETEAPTSEVPSDQEGVSVGNDGEKAGLASDNMVSIDEEPTTSIELGNTGRADPFLPETEAIASRPKPKANLPFDLLPPTESLGSGETVEKILTTKVSGIMYDNYSPSAILNIDDVDYLVRSGDVINNYKVLSISKNVVTIQSGANTYKAGVGQLLQVDNLNNGNIANLENKFGGSKNRSY